MRQNADILTLDENGEEVYATSPGGGCTLEFDVEDPEFDGEEEYDTGDAIDDLAMRMDVPPPGSDEDSAVEEARQHLSKAGSALSKKKGLSGSRSEEKLRRKSSSTKLNRSPGEKSSRRSKSHAESS